MNNKIIIFLLFTLTFLGSCITPRETNFLQDIEKNYPTDETVSVDYRIIPGDQLVLIVYTLDESMESLFSMFIASRVINPNTTQNASIGGGGGGFTTSDLPGNVLTVSSKGTINIPYLGEIYVLDMTILEAKKAISEKFQEFTSLVTVDLTLRNRYFFVLGEMGSRAVRMNNLRMTIFQALAQANNITNFADRKHVKIIRQTASGTEVKTFDLRSQDILNSDFYYIQPNDVIYAPQMQRKFFGSITSFAGVFGFISAMVGTALAVWAVVDKVK